MSASLIILLLVLAVIASTVTLIVRGISAGKGAVAETIRIRDNRRAAGPVAGLVIRPLAVGDRRAWERLWDSYCEFYGETLPASATETTWSRMMDSDSPVKGWLPATPKAL